MLKSKMSMLTTALVLVTACGGREEIAPAEPVEPQAPRGPVASTQLSPRAGESSTGQVRFLETEDGATIVATVEGAAPGLHGLHLHESGDCGGADFTSAGGHFNPTVVPHGGPGDAIRHAGDFGNIEVGEDGTGRLELDTEMLTVSSGPSSVVGHAVILHELEDDLLSQPSGAVGSRLACGVVRR